MPYEVKTPVFEGPFDLLLHLIMREQVDLYEVPLVRIVDAYIAELDRMEHLDLEVATEFLLISATLIELKKLAVPITCTMKGTPVYWKRHANSRDASASALRMSCRPSPP